MDYIPSEKITGAVRRWSVADFTTLRRRLRRDAVLRSMFFHFKVGVKRYVPMALKPWVVTEEQRRYLRSICMGIESAAKRIYKIWFVRKDLQRLLPLSPDEIRWFRDSYGGDYMRPETLFSRMDVSTDLGRPDWKESARFLEINLVGIGATYYCYCAGQMAAQYFAPRLSERLGVAKLESENDLLEMIIRRCHAHGAKIGRPKPTVAFVEYKRIEQGPFEYQTMQHLYRDRGYRVVVADPIELRIKGGEIRYEDTRVDLLYRDPTLAELVEMEREGDDLRAVKLAFQRNQVVSSLSGEMDHKGIFELFSSEAYAGLFSPEERRVLRKHVPWTRVLRAARTDDPKGRVVDLPEFVRKNREALVIKPNRDYGGHGVWLGNRAGARDWDRAIQQAVTEPSSCVVQQRMEFLKDVTPVLEDGRVRFRERFAIVGVHAGEDETAILARISEEPIVNITRGGAIVGVLVARP